MALPLVVVAILWGLAFMPLKGTGLGVRLDVGLAWLAALSILLLVPTDVANALQVSPLRHTVGCIARVVVVTHHFLLRRMMYDLRDVLALLQTAAS